MTLSRRKGYALLVALFAVSVFLGHAWLFGSWVVDDAGISLAYARNLAEGKGLVAQPGNEPVEGVSNTLWTLLLAATHALGWLDPVWTPKVLSGLLVSASFFLLSFELIGGYGRPPWLVGLALAATAAATPFVVWCVSGLENALSVALVSALAAGSLRMARRARAETHEVIFQGCLCFLLYLTRPDGVVYLGAPPFLMGFLAIPRAGKKVGLHALAFLLPWVFVTSCRLAYFGDVFPNTYYAKHGPGWRETAWLLETLGAALGGTIFLILAGLLTACGVALAVFLGAGLGRRLDLPPAPTVLGTYFLAAYAAFELLPTDWMPEYRFGTALFLLGPLLVIELLTRLPIPGRFAGTRATALAGAVVLLAGAVVYSSRHTPAFRRQPTVPFDDVRVLSVALDEYGQSLGVERATVLLPDIGGSLWEDRFDVVDLAGLTNRAIGRTLRSDRDAFLSYVLDRQPDLIWVHGYWKTLTHFESVPEFTARYDALSPAATLGRDDGVLYVDRSLLIPQGAPALSPPLPLGES